MATRVKVTCTYKSPIGGENIPAHIQFSPVTSGSEENQKFFAATPGGSFAFYTVNKEAADQFEIGKEYYFDIFAAEKVPHRPEAQAA
jgi:hypothetical protein